jgi:hypothetical protein
MNLCDRPIEQDFRQNLSERALRLAKYCYLTIRAQGDDVPRSQNGGLTHTRRLISKAYRTARTVTGEPGGQGLRSNV